MLKNNIATNTGNVKTEHKPYIVYHETLDFHINKHQTLTILYTITSVLTEKYNNMNSS